MNILFVSHAANRSGAPLVLLELLRYLKRETAHRATVLSLRDGPLLEEFGRVATLWDAAPLVRLSKLGAAQRRLHSFQGAALARFEPSVLGLQRLQSRQARGAVRRAEDDFDLVYLNSVASGDVLSGLEPILRRAPLLTHVHEMKWALDGLGSAFAAVKAKSSRFIAVSGLVKTQLEQRGIAAQNIETVYEFVDFEALLVGREASRRELRAQLRLPDETFLVGGCGTMEWRKGPDFWAGLAAQSPDAHFVWLGGQKNELWRQIGFDLKRSGARDRVHFLPPTARPAPFFAALDAFALTSREDPFPLVGIEAAAQGVPLLCFEGAGGLSELVQNDAGMVSPYGDVSAMARQLEMWRLDAPKRLEMGQIAAQRARRMCDVSVGAAQIVKIAEAMAR